jgi:hypothetical protein
MYTCCILVLPTSRATRFNPSSNAAIPGSVLHGMAGVSPQFPPDVIAYQQAHIHENLGPTVIIVASVLLALDVFAVTGRFCARYTLKVKLGWDDWLILPGLVCLLSNVLEQTLINSKAMIACMLVEVVYGM